MVNKAPSLVSTSMQSFWTTQRLCKASPGNRKYLFLKQFLMITLYIHCTHFKVLSLKLILILLSQKHSIYGIWYGTLTSCIALFFTRTSMRKIKCAPQAIQHRRLSCVTFVHCPDLLRLSATPNNSVVLDK